MFTGNDWNDMCPCEFHSKTYDKHVDNQFSQKQNHEYLVKIIWNDVSQWCEKKTVDCDTLVRFIWKKLWFLWSV